MLGVLVHWAYAYADRVARQALHIQHEPVPLADHKPRNASVSFVVTFHGTEVPPGWEADQERILRKEVDLCWPDATVERYLTIGDILKAVIGDAPSEGPPYTHTFNPKFQEDEDPEDWGIERDRG